MRTVLDYNSLPKRVPTTEIMLFILATEVYELNGWMFWGGVSYLVLSTLLRLFLMGTQKYVNIKDLTNK